MREEANLVDENKPDKSGVVCRQGFLWALIYNTFNHAYQIEFVVYELNCQEVGVIKLDNTTNCSVISGGGRWVFYKFPWSNLNDTGNLVGFLFSFYISFFSKYGLNTIEN